MTKRERAQVVELLRCAAWVAASQTWHPLMTCGDTAATRLDVSKETSKVAERVMMTVTGARHIDDSVGDADAYIAACLEAAARVEEGSWP